MTVLGIDGGGTKTAAAVVTSQGQLLAFGRGGPCNTNFVPPKVAQTSIETAVDEALTRAGPGARPAAVVVGAPVAREVLDTALDRYLAAVPRHTPGEGVLALEAAGIWTEGAAVVSGTGSLAIARAADGRVVSVGGWGTLLGDDGSAYSIGHGALRAAVLQADGRLDGDVVLRIVMGWANVAKPRDLVKVVYHPAMNRTRIAALARQVSDAAGGGDPVAVSLLGQAGRDLAEQALTAIRRLGIGCQNPVRVAATGSVLLASDRVMESLKTIVQDAYPRARVFRAPLAPAVAGAVWGLRQMDAFDKPAVAALFGDSFSAEVG